MILNPHLNMFKRRKGATVDKRFNGALGSAEISQQPLVQWESLIVFLRVKERTLDVSRKLVVLSVETGNIWK